MKTIKMMETDTVKGRDVVKIVMEQPGQGGATIEQVRRRCKVLDALDGAADGELKLEDAEFEFLSTTLKAFPFAAASRDLLKVVDALITPIRGEAK